MELTMVQFNSKYQMEVIDLVGTIYGSKKVYKFDRWEEIQFFLPFDYKLASRMIVLAELKYDGINDEYVVNEVRQKEFSGDELTFLEQVNEALTLFGDSLQVKDNSKDYGILLVDLPSSFFKYTYITRRIIADTCYHVALNSDKLIFLAEEGAKAVFTREEVEADAILRRYYFKELSRLELTRQED